MNTPHKATERAQERRKQSSGPPTHDRYFPAYDPSTKDFVVISFRSNLILDHFPNLLECERLINEMKTQDREDEPTDE